MQVLYIADALRVTASRVPLLKLRQNFLCIPCFAIEIPSPVALDYFLSRSELDFAKFSSCLSAISYSSERVLLIPTMSSGVKRQRQPAASSNAESSKKRRTQTRAAPKSRGPYRFTFGKYKGKTIQEVHDEDFGYIEDVIVFEGMMGGNDILKKNPALRTGLRDLPKSWLEQDSSLERLLDNDQPGGPSIYEYEAMVPNQGMMKMNEQSSSCKF